MALESLSVTYSAVARLSLCENAIIYYDSPAAEAQRLADKKQRHTTLAKKRIEAWINSDVVDHQLTRRKELVVNRCYMDNDQLVLWHNTLTTAGYTCTFDENLFTVAITTHEGIQIINKL